MVSPARSQRPREPSVSSVTKGEPSLLPAFEPFSSSPLPSSKRKLGEVSPSPAPRTTRYYPTPIPTSQTNLIPTSPIRITRQNFIPSSPTRIARPNHLQRTVSELACRKALGDVTAIEIPISGEPILLGRSNNASDIQFSTSRLVSRIHLSAQYHPTRSPAHPYGELAIECLGWNGADIHYASTVSKITKGEVFTATKPEMEIMVDVCDSRVFLRWPATVAERCIAPVGDDSSGESSPQNIGRSAIGDPFLSSPPPMVSGTPPHSPRSGDSDLIFGNMSGVFTSAAGGDQDQHGEVQVYEDVEAPNAVVNLPAQPLGPQILRARSGTMKKVAKEDDASDVSSGGEELSDHNEENDPIIHSFGPYGVNLLPHFASFNTSENHGPPVNASRTALHTSPEQSASHGSRPITPPPQGQPRVLKTPSPTSRRRAPSSPSPFKINESPVKNHVVNQLAYSRLHSMPLSAILGNLPAELRGSLSLQQRGAAVDDDAAHQLMSDRLKMLLRSIACVGEIPREGKDAAGKPLEDEYYYVPEMDNDQMRRDAVTGGIGRTGLRAVRRSHKQYYWKRPRH